jgi:hypothetical protein
MNSPHPIQERPDLPLDRRVQLLEQALAQLWDQVWWMALPVDQRRAYEADGFRQPIERFYHD